MARDEIKTLLQNYREDLQRHEDMDIQAFKRLEDKLDTLGSKVSDELASQREEFGYVFLALKMIGAVSVAAWAAVKLWFAYIVNKG